MHLGDELGLRQVELVERSVEEDALRVEHRPHGAVADEHAAGEGFDERGSGHWLSVELERARVNQQIRVANEVEADRPNALTLLLGEPVMVAEQVEPRLHRRENLVHRGLPRIVPPRPPVPAKYGRGASCVRNRSTPAQGFACFHLFPDEMPPLVRQLGRLRRTLARVRQRRCRRLVPRGRERPPSPATRMPLDLRGRPLGR